MTFVPRPLRCHDMFLAHPNGRIEGEGVYVAATNNMRRDSLRDFITTNVRESAALTREGLEQMWAWRIWRL